MTTAADRLVVPPSTGWVQWGDTVYPAALPDGPPLVLTGPGAVVWNAVVEGGTLAEVVERVAARVGQPVEEVAPGVEEFVAGLVAAGVVARQASAR
ncbi:PqqD family protein [Oryzobacter sp. R7]|uniref:PqqD family protein n=1 Tax=Oryzobacter faecalis TaxID=3388656 RepID=UPI00398D685E